MDEIGARLERIELREDAAKSLQIRRILTLAGLELDDRDVHGWRHRRKHVTRRGHRQPGRGYIPSRPRIATRIVALLSQVILAPLSGIPPCRT
jgi:hypothetical protein